MRGGTLDTRIRLQRRGEGQDDGTTRLPGAWENLKAEPVWASERAGPGQARFANAEAAASAVTVWRIRWDPDLADLKAEDRLLKLADDDVAILETFDVISADEIGRQNYIEITTVKRTDD
jgi:hypothetical protein